MQLILNTFGMSLRVKDGCFQVQKESRKETVAPRKISSILVTTGVLLSSDVLKLAIENNIDVVFLNEYGNPFGRVWHDRPGSITTIRRRQLSLVETENGLNFVKEWIDQKIVNQITFLEHLRKTRSRHSAEITDTIAHINGIVSELSEVSGVPESTRETIMNIEARAAKLYFQLISNLMPESFRFEGRSRNPARDKFNCLLNYAYGVLYGKVERACVLAGLDPYIGILHTDNYGKKSLVFDLIENFRIWADETTIALISARNMKETHFDRLKNGFTLNKDGKATLLSRYMAFLEESIRFRNRNIKRIDTIQLVCHRFANRLLGKDDPDMVPEIVTGEEVLACEGR